MKDILIKNIAQLLQVNQKPVKGSAMNVVPQIPDAWLYIKEGVIDSFGAMSALPKEISAACLQNRGLYKYPHRL